MRIVCVCLIVCFGLSFCTKHNDQQPKSKIDYIPVWSANTPKSGQQGQEIHSKVTCGFANHFADITFLGFEVKEKSNLHFDIRAKAFYDNIIYGFALQVLNTFDTTLVIQTPVVGQYVLDFYSFNQFTESDTVRVN